MFEFGLLREISLNDNDYSLNIVKCNDEVLFNFVDLASPLEYIKLILYNNKWEIFDVSGIDVVETGLYKYKFNQITQALRKIIPDVRIINQLRELALRGYGIWENKYKQNLVTGNLIDRELIRRGKTLKKAKSFYKARLMDEPEQFWIKHTKDLESNPVEYMMLSDFEEEICNNYKALKILVNKIYNFDAIINDGISSQNKKKLAKLAKDNAVNSIVKIIPQIKNTNLEIAHLDEMLELCILERKGILHTL